MARPPVSITTLPIEVIHHLSSTFLTPTSVSHLSQTCSLFRRALDSESLWRLLSDRCLSISYIEPGGSWRKNCLDPQFIDTACPHLSNVWKPECVKERKEMYKRLLGSIPYDKVRCSHPGCEIGTPDLWFCLEEGCTSMACGRTKNKHALQHCNATNHLLNFRINTLEVWCFECVKWVGNRLMPLAEQTTVQEMVRELVDIPQEPFLTFHKEAQLRDRRFFERDMYHLSESDKTFFLSLEFLQEWGQFLVGYGPPPTSINNKSLILPNEFLADTHLPLMNPSLVPHVDFGIIGESAWESLFKTYGGGPPVSLDNIPATDPSYTELIAAISSAKSIIVEQCLENARRLKPGTGKNKTITTETYMIKSSLMKLVESQNKYTHPTRATTGVPNGSIRRRRSSVEETLLKKQQGLLDLPHEIIYMVAYHYLDCNSVITLTRTNKILRGVLYTSQNLWQKLTMDRHGINYIEEGGDWRDACFNPDFYEFCCPHLSALSTIAVQERTEFLGKSSNTSTLSCMSCATPPPDLWLCLSPNCTSISCGRAKHQHALEHSQTHRHPLAVKLFNLEIWCYACVKWIGNQLQPLAEQQKLASLTTCLRASAPESTKHQVKLNKQRIEERLMHIVEDGDRVFFVSRAFLDVWMRFLVGDEGVPVGGIDNSGLVDESGGRWMKSDLLPLIDFGIVSETSWNTLVRRYGGGPALSEANIPRDDPAYFSLLREIAEAKANIVRQSRDDARLLRGSNSTLSIDDNEED